MSIPIELFKDLAIETSDIHKEHINGKGLIRRFLDSKIDDRIWFPSIGHSGEWLDVLMAGFNVLSQTYKEGSTFLDLGSGDGLVSFLATFYGFNAIGIEMNKFFFNRSHEIKKRFLEYEFKNVERADFIRGDYYKVTSEIQDVDIFYIFPYHTDLERIQKLYEGHGKPDSCMVIFDSDESIRNIVFRKYNCKKIQLFNIYCR